MSNFRLYKADGTTQDLEALTVTGWQTSQRKMRLAQSPGGSQAFVVGRGTRLTTPIRLRVLVDEADEATARTTLSTITSFARESTQLARVDASGNLIDTVALTANPLSQVSPEPMHLGGDAWSTLIELRPLRPAFMSELVEFNSNTVTFNSVPVTWSGG